MLRSAQHREAVLTEPITDPPADSRIPKFKVPFEISRTGRRVRAATVDQDSPEEIRQCIYAIVATDLDSREELPEFGNPDQQFTDRYDVTEVDEAIERWEPRAAWFSEADFDVETNTEHVDVGV